MLLQWAKKSRSWQLQLQDTAAQYVTYGKRMSSQGSQFPRWRGRMIASTEPSAKSLGTILQLKRKAFQAEINLRIKESHGTLWFPVFQLIETTGLSAFFAQVKCTLAAKKIEGAKNRHLHVYSHKC